MGTESFLRIGQQVHSRPHSADFPCSTNGHPVLKVVKGFTRSEPYRSRSFDRQNAYRYLLQLRDGNVVETSGYQHYDNDIRVDYSVDISSMVGCPMRCRFCESALLKYVRSLDESEMIAQVSELTARHGDGFPRITCSFQGIGEASLIPDRVLCVSRHLLESDSRNEISIATIGERLSAFKKWREAGLTIDNLQLSCSGTTEDQIRTVMPRGPRIDELIKELILCSESETFNKVKLNYVLMAGFNDDPADVARLISLLRDTSIVVKVSALNITQASRASSLRQASEDVATRIADELATHGIASYVYGPFNATNVSCGQLAYACTEADARAGR